MTTAEKMIAIAENEQRVFDAGKQSMVDPTKIIEKTVSGSLIRVDDVSEIPHKCTVSADKETNATVCGKNLYKHTDYGFISGADGGFTATKTATGYSITGTYSNGCFILIPLCSLAYLSGKQVALSADIGGNSASFQPVVCSADYSTRKSISIYNGSFGIPQASEYPDGYIVAIRLGGDKNNDPTAVVTYDNIQVEIGETKTACEPFKAMETFIIASGQTIEIDSICPTMTLLTENDAVITFGYHKSWGMQTEYDRFWDAFQDNGNRVLYQYAYAYMGWNGTTYNPKHIDKPTNASNLFYESQVPVVKNLDLSNCTNEDQLCRNSKIEDAGVIDTSKTSLLYYTFHNAQALRNLKLILKDDGTQTFNGAFFRNYALESLEVVGTIGNNGLTFADATKLTHESLMSIINALMYVGHTYTKTNVVVEPVGFYPSGQNFAPDWPAYTTTGEKVLCGYDNNATMIYCCLVDGVYYAVTEAPNTATYTLTLGTTNLAKLEDWEKETATSKGWTLV